MAANATFALKPGLCVRRTRLVMVAPDTRHSRRSQAETPLIGLSEFGQPPLFLIGERENDGGPLYLNLGAPFAGQPIHGPHTLIAGETGGGKGVLTRNLILDIC